MPRGVFKDRKERWTEIIKFLGRKPKDTFEYEKIRKFLFRGDSQARKLEMKKQKQRHTGHSYGKPNVNRGYCPFCEKEGRV